MHQIQLFNIPNRLVKRFTGGFRELQSNYIKKSFITVPDRITESQNHRMVGVGRDLCGSSSPTLLPKQGHLQ